MAIYPARYSFWGGHFPSGARSFWGGHFPEPGADPTVVLPSGPGGVDAFALVLESGATAMYSWTTDVFKARSGKERRAGLLDRPREAYKGTAHIVGAKVRNMRGALARYAASGIPFQLGMPHEDVAIIAPSSGTIATVGDTSTLDWANPGQRVLVRAIISGVPTTIGAVIQSVTSTTITLDATLGALGIVGARIMPTVAVYLDATQTFGRYKPRAPVEDWQISARAVGFGFRISGRAATLSLVGQGVLAGLTVVARAIGAAGNLITFRVQHATLGVGVNVVVTESAGAVLVQYRSGVATVLQVCDAITAGSTLVAIQGSYAPTDTLSTDFGPLSLTGGLDASLAPVGRGASLTMYDGKPVWDRGLVNDDTASDSIQALTTLIDLGGVPLSASDASVADWGRSAAFRSAHRAAKQWLKLFLWTVQGRRRSWWLPSWRNDLIPQSVAAGTAGVAASLPLLPPLVNSGSLEGLTIVSRTVGGNDIAITFSGDAIDNAGDLDEDPIARTVHVRFVPTMTTDVQIKALLVASSALVTCTGTTHGGVLQAGDDEFTDTHLYGGVAATGATLVVGQDGDSGDFAAWMSQRDRLQILQTDGTITYTRIVSTFADGVAGTFRLGLDASLSAVAIRSVSWLELVRFEADDAAPTFGDTEWTLAEQARVIQLRTDGAEASYAADEQSAEQSLPREGIEILMGLTPFRIATGDQDIVINGYTYKASPGQRAAIDVDSNSVTSTLEIQLPLSHDAMQRYFRNCLPPQSIIVNIYRQQERSGQYERVYTGTWMSLTWDAHVGKALVAASMGNALARVVPMMVLGRGCQYVLFDRNCRKSPAGFTVPTTVAVGGAVGTQITVTSMSGKPDQWAQYGYLRHVATGQRISITSQVGNVLTLRFPNPDIRDGDIVEVVKGCDHTVFTCRDTFNNVVNYGGAPAALTIRPFKSNNKGVWL